MNKYGEKKGKTPKGEKDNKSPKVNKTRANDNKLPPEKKGEKAADISNKFPNFSVLNEEERLAFFEALTAARKNVQKRGGPARERFGTVHDEYLEYFNRKEKKGDESPEEERPLASDPVLRGPRRDRPSFVLDGGDTPEEIADEKPRGPTSPLETPPRGFLRSRGEPVLLERCESVIEEDTNRILGLYHKKKKRNDAKVDAANKKTEEPKTPKMKTEEREEKRKKKKNENALARKVPETCLKMKNTPRFNALNAEEKGVFFKILNEARNNIVVKNPDKKKEILPMDSIMRRYRGDVVTETFAVTQEPRKYGQGKKNLKVKVTLTSADNERLLQTKPENSPEKLSKTEEVKESGHESTPLLISEDLVLMEISKTKIAEKGLVDGKYEEILSGHAIRKQASADAAEIINPKAMKKSAREEENPPAAEAEFHESFKKGKTKNPKKNPSIDKEVDEGSREPQSEGSLFLQGNSSTSLSKPGNETPGRKGVVTNAEKSSEKKENGKTRGEAKKQESDRTFTGVGSDSREVPEERRNGTQRPEENEEYQGMNLSATREFDKSPGSSKGEEIRKVQSHDEVGEKNDEEWCAEEESSETQCREVEEVEEPLKEENVSADQREGEEKESGNYLYTNAESSECPSLKTPETMNIWREHLEGGISAEEQDASKGDVERREAEPPEGGACREEEEKGWGSQEVFRRESLEEKTPPQTENAIATAKVMIVDDNVIDKIRNLIYYLEAKAESDGRLEAEYIKLVVNYVEYLSKVLEALALKREQEQAKNAFVAAQIHLKFNEAKNKEPKLDMGKFVARSVSEQDFAKPKFLEEKKKKEEKPKEKESKNEDLVPLSDSDSSLESEPEIHYVPPVPVNQQVVTTKIRLLQDLIKKRAEFVRTSTEDFTIVYHPQEEFVPVPRTKTVKMIREENDGPIQGKKRKFLEAILKFCNCGKKKQEEDGVFENLKGEAVRVDVTEDKRDVANATLNQSMIDVLKASGRKKIIEKYYSKD